MVFGSHLLTGTLTKPTLWKQVSEPENGDKCAMMDDVLCSLRNTGCKYCSYSRIYCCIYRCTVSVLEHLLCNKSDYTKVFTCILILQRSVFWACIFHFHGANFS